MGAHELHDTARAIVADDKGILAADESTGTIKKRFDAIGVESTEENRRFYRQLLFTAPGMEDFIGGVILYDETIRQSADDGTPLAEVLAAKGVIPGIKVDAGAHDLAGFPGEKVTEGLDGLRARLEEYRGLGARFAKWRAVITIGDGHPDGRVHRGERARARALRRALPGGRASCRSSSPRCSWTPTTRIERCYEVTTRRCTDVPRAARSASISRACCSSRTWSSREGLRRAGAARADRRGDRGLLPAYVPAAVPGIVFLSGGQSEDRRPRTSTRSTGSAGRGCSRSRTAGLFSSRRCRPGAATPRTGGGAGRVCAPRTHERAGRAGGWRAELEQPVAA